MRKIILQKPKSFVALAVPKELIISNKMEHITNSVENSKNLFSQINNLIMESGDFKDISIENQNLAANSSLVIFENGNNNNSNSTINFTTAASEVQQNVTRQVHIPYILNGELYQIITQDGENVTVQCRHCPPDRVYRGSVRSTGNFHMHIKVIIVKIHRYCSCLYEIVFVISVVILTC